jgi:hypothetical protein
MQRRVQQGSIKVSCMPNVKFVGSLPDEDPPDSDLKNLMIQEEKVFLFIYVLFFSFLLILGMMTDRNVI